MCGDWRAPAETVRPLGTHRSPRRTFRGRSGHPHRRHGPRGIEHSPATGRNGIRHPCSGRIVSPEPCCRPEQHPTCPITDPLRTSFAPELMAISSGQKVLEWMRGFVCSGCRWGEGLQIAAFRAGLAKSTAAWSRRCSRASRPCTALKSRSVLLIGIRESRRA
jgi:hypothetical protein